MKFNTTYISKINLKNTIKAMAFIRQDFLTMFNKSYDLIEVDIPIFLEENDERIISFQTITRDLSYDLLSDSKIVKSLSSPSNYLRELIDRLNCKDHQGVISYGKFLFRDKLETPTETIVQHEMIIQIKLEDERQLEVELQKVNEMIYNEFYHLANYIETEYKVKNIFEKVPYYIHAQDLENENPNQKPLEREINFSFEKNAFFLVNTGKKLHSGKTHKYLPIAVYDLNNYYELILKDRINTSVIHSAQVSILANGIQLSDQLTLSDNEKFKQLDFYKKLLEQKYKVMEIRLNIPAMAMSLLGKGHICEVQPGVISDEVSIIVQKYNVEKY